MLVLCSVCSSKFMIAKYLNFCGQSKPRFAFLSLFLYLCFSPPPTKPPQVQEREALSAPEPAISSICSTTHVGEH